MRHAVCMVTDRRRLGANPEEALLRRVGEAARAGVHLIQIREPDLEAGALLSLVARAIEAARGTRARILVNDRTDVALAAGAHGVHLRGDSAPAPRVRSIVPAGFLIGRSVHEAAEAVRVARDGQVDYLLYGTVFETGSKPGVRATGVAGLESVTAAVSHLPVLAIGGITLDNVHGLRGSGCAGFAAIGMFADVPESLLGMTVAGAVAPWENLE